MPLKVFCFVFHFGAFMSPGQEDETNGILGSRLGEECTGVVQIYGQKCRALWGKEQQSWALLSV